MSGLYALDVRSQKKFFQAAFYPAIPYAISCERIPMIKPV